jgi:hypothetical protein
MHCLYDVISRTSVSDSTGAAMCHRPGQWIALRRSNLSPRALRTPFAGVEGEDGQGVVEILPVGDPIVGDAFANLRSGHISIRSRSRRDKLGGGNDFICSAYFKLLSEAIVAYTIASSVDIRSSPLSRSSQHDGWFPATQSTQQVGIPWIPTETGRRRDRGPPG